MIVHYRGYKINVTREKCLGGWPLVYYSIYRDSDGYCCVESFEDSDDSVRDYVKWMKNHVDESFKENNYWGEDALSVQS